MKINFIFLLAIILSNLTNAQIKHGLRDDAGRYIVARGFVVITNERNFKYDKLSKFPGSKIDDNYLSKLDTLVNLGKRVGIETVFKMTVYGVDDFSWEGFWANKKGEYETYLDAWKVVWNRYKNEENVIGYDVVNEPRKLSMDITYNDLTTKYLMPL